MSQLTLKRTPVFTAHLRNLQLLLLTSAMLLVFGALLIASASMDLAADHYGNPFYFAFRQIIYILMGLVVGLVVVNVPLSWWLRSGWLCLFVAMGLLMLVLTPLGLTVNGSTRWIPLGIINVQVSEVAKILLIAYMAGYVVRRREELINTWKGFFKPLVVLVMAAFLLVIQPDFGATVVIMTAAMGMIFLSGVRLSRFMPLIGLFLVAAVLLIITQPYRLKRVVAYLDPWQDQFDTGYQLTQSLIAFGRGEWVGVGLGNSVQKLFYLPEAHTDFVFAIAAEEFGLLGSLAILGTFTVLIWVSLNIARNAEKAGMAFGACFAYGITLLLALQAFINMAVNTGLLPTKGLTLPLVSYGGSSMMASCASIAILARVEMERLDLLEHREGGKA
ncbi:MAG: putative lipid II flippase FtsW [Halomonadaceae bacterium]|nr:MAG: putative lipid II flippase FtsW [Halomonadaceae bacterium]